MDILKMVIDSTLDILSTNITFGTHTFSLMSVHISIALFAIVCVFLRKLFD